jgi:hypothetical protein
MTDRHARTNAWMLVAGLALLVALAAGLPGQQRKGGGKRGPQSEVFHTDVPAHSFDAILARPTDRSVTASILAYQDMEGYLEYGTKQGAYTNRTQPLSLGKGVPDAVLLQPLQPDSRYYYRLRHRLPGSSAFEAGAEWTFHTQRRPGSAFTFAVQADSHLDENTDPAIYRLTLENALAGKPDFFVDLGDTFMTDKRRTDFRQALPQYLAQRYYFGLLCHSAPLFLTLGNHDGESGARYDGKSDSMPAWSLGLRKRYFPNPRPDAFYTGNEANDPALGPLENYYAWEWGGALFVVLDPYWPTAGRGRDDNWSWTLGAPQYRWLSKTLTASRARLKFVFIHHPVGGKGQPIRGGIDAARYNEWGGRNPDGTEGFKQHRPGWEMPIHQLLVKDKVSAVFHGHDHMFVKEELDGIAYQLLPQPGNPRIGNPRNAEEYGYVHGGVMAGSGHLRVRVSQEKALVEYVVSALPIAAAGGPKNGAVALSYPAPK